MMIIQDLLRFDRYPIFQIPVAQRGALEARLIELGVDPRRWFSCIYYRQGNSDLRGRASYRDVDDRPFEALARHIIADMGGQVVRIGHSAMRPWDIGEGFVDLSRLEDEFMTQAAAVSLARFMISTSSGPGHLPGVFDVPYAITNTLSIWLVWKSNDLVLPNHLIDPNGARVDLRRLIDSGLFNQDSIRTMVERRAYRLVENTAGELCALADMLHGATTDCPGWRRSVPPPPPPPPNFFGFPQPYRRKVNIVEFPQHWPRF
jgi:putative glycosyltransferase (TIGR04372 family)